MIRSSSSCVKEAVTHNENNIYRGLESRAVQGQKSENYDFPFRESMQPGILYQRGLWDSDGAGLISFNYPNRRHRNQYNVVHEWPTDGKYFWSRGIVFKVNTKYIFHCVETVLIQNANSRRVESCANIKISSRLPL